jgi:REP element-mobilizing transposase RayT
LLQHRLVVFEAASVGTFDDLSAPFLYARVATRRRHAALRQGDTAGHVTSEWLRTSRRFDVTTLAYCLMPDHVHVLTACLSSRGDPRAALGRWKTLTGQTYRLRTGLGLWREGRSEWTLADLDDAMETARYLVRAPVRAGLVPTPLQYRWLMVSRWRLDDLVAGGEPSKPDWWPERATWECRSGR